LVALLTTAALFGSGSQAFAAHVWCGDVITQDTTLDSDLVDCPGDGIVIGADDVTLDLDGHTVDGDGDPLPGLGRDTGIVNGRFDNYSGQEPGHDGVTIRGGTVREFAHGVQVVIADRTSLLQLRLYDNSGFGGIVSYLMSNGRIERNLAAGNQSAGIALYEPVGRTEIAGNVAARNLGYGIELAGGLAGDRFENNVTFGNRASGLFIFSARGLRVSGNRSFGNGGTGIALLGAYDNYVDGNRVWDNGIAGINLSGSADRNRVERNTVFHNAADAPQPRPYSGGITVDEGDENQLVGNRVFDNGGQGGVVIRAMGGGSVVTSNHVRSNTGHGIFHATSFGERESVIAGNHSMRNGGDGIHVLQAAALRGNHTDRNGDDGIDARSNKIALVANRAIRNFDLGIEAVPGVIDGGRNRALGNGNPLQCLNVFCR
jgi:parallel beta-helix repeat protein